MPATEKHQQKIVMSTLTVWLCESRGHKSGSQLFFLLCLGGGTLLEPLFQFRRGTDSETVSKLLDIWMWFGGFFFMSLLANSSGHGNRNTVYLRPILYHPAHGKVTCEHV